MRSSLVRGCFVTSMLCACSPSGDGPSRTVVVFGSEELEGAYYLDGSGVDVPGTAGVVSPPEGPCRKSSDCASGGCFGATSTTPGTCLAVCAAAANRFDHVRPCVRGVERCLYLPRRALGLCLPLCTSDRDCPAKSRCKPVAASRPDLGSLCDD